ncbi:MAG: sigma-70 family RNA polymerase sigma factor [Gemmataceae bacterium]
MNAETERQLIHAAQHGDERAVACLEEAHRGFIQGAARRYFHAARRILNRKGLEREDLEQEATVGFLLGLYHFDLDQQVRLLTYASYWIDRCVAQMLRDAEDFTPLTHVHQAAMLQEQRDVVSDSDELNTRLRFLPVRLREAIRLRFGLDTGAPHTHAQVGASLGVGRSRAGQLLLDANDRLRRRRRL